LENKGSYRKLFLSDCIGQASKGVDGRALENELGFVHSQEVGHYLNAGREVRIEVLFQHRGVKDKQDGNLQRKREKALGLKQ
jgi:hypothetical protein